jgi:polyhydroxyalkanoate synthase subunit PhaC
MEALQSPLDLAVSRLALYDAARRRRGAWFERFGFAPVRVPGRAIWTGPRARLLAYDGQGSGAALLLLPAPIKRAYIWDLVPEVSVIRRCLGAGLRVHLLEWTDPAAADARLGLGDHVERVVMPALEAVLAATGERQAVLSGHSLGGTLAAIAAALHPERVAGLALIETPLRFGADAGALGPLIAATPRATTAALGRGFVPGSLLSLWGVSAAPDAFLAEPWLDWLASAGNGTRPIHARVKRWTDDELAIPGPLFVDIVEGLYREDRLAAGALTIDGRRVDPRALAEIPVLAIVPRESRVVPPGSTLGLFADLPMRELRVLHYDGEVGVAVQHVGPLVGPAAHRRLWPQILAWIEAHQPEVRGQTLRV